MKFNISRTILRYNDGRKDFINNEIKTNDIEAERKLIKQKYGCDNVNFCFEEIIKDKTS